MAVADTLVMGNAEAQSLFDPVEQAWVRDHVRGRMVRTDQSVEHVELPTGKVVRLRGGRVMVGDTTAGVICAVELVFEPAGPRPARPRFPHPGDDDTAGVSSCPLPRVPRVADSAPATACSPLWQRASDSITAALSEGSALLLMGERGAGKATLASAIHTRMYPDGRVVAVKACDVAHVDLPDRTDDDAAWLLYLFQNIDELDMLGVRALQASITSLGRLARVQVAATLDGRHISSPRPFQEILPLFGSAVTVPPLRHRMSDLPELVAAVLGGIVPDRPVTVSPAAMRVMSRFSWPQNVSQVEDALRSALRRRPVGEIQVEDLPGYCHSSPRRTLSGLEAMERDLIVTALGVAGGNRVRAAAALGIARSSLYRKIRSFGITEG